jgi:hypothetical protein
MNKLLDAEDILAEARNCVECIFMAASGLGGGLKHEATGPIQVVADIASKKITEAIALLVKCRPAPSGASGTGEADAKPKSPPARTNRRSK